ncbi:hypothetical protein CAPTEDRAFT_144410 [Capitella teleta]|uniref:Mediator of RNA polymerase II transcription subunit 11 n=1 Tax=Capitella teleta TaxID=283909 RepID=R7THJ2_CAPTE|nr:hypothetical protein CAPTEDRAFT_144410 [Capitella teleta]|eukprot:ELT92917.1 hypothetical protein CAPTEDRAFT_144410 [Capitella teleta]
MSAPRERIKQLEDVERDVTSSLQCAAQALAEMTKEKPNAKQIEASSTQFIKKLEGVEKTLVEQLQYLASYSTGQSHEGSSYARSKDLQMTNQRMFLVKRRLDDLQLLANERRLRNSSNTTQESASFHGHNAYHL